MARPQISLIPMLFALLGAAVSCAPKAIVVAEPPAPKVDVPAEVPPLAEAPVPADPDDGLRLPDMLTMPAEGDFRATVPTPASGAAGPGGVTVRPPTEPPPRPKPKEPEGR